MDSPSTFFDTSDLFESAHKIPLPEFFQQLKTNEVGLSSAEAARRLQQFGPNALTGKKRIPEYIKFLRQFKNYFAVLLIIGGLLALLADKLDRGQGYFYISCALFGVVLLNANFTYIQERQTERIMESFSRMLPRMVTIMRNGLTLRLEAQYVVPGDLMLLQEGDRICADGRLIEQNQMKIDPSSLTGESEPELRHLQATHANIMESRNMVFSGALVQSSNGKAIIYATGMATQIGCIVQLTHETQESISPIGKELRYFIKIISSIALFLALSFSSSVWQQVKGL